MICALPFVLMMINQKKRARQILNALSQMANENQTQIQEYEICGQLAIAIDSGKKHLFYYLKTDQSEFNEVIVLDTIKNCSEKVIYNHEDDSRKTVQELSITFNLKQGTPKTWQLYHADIQPQLDGELQLMKKWVHLINQRP